MQGKTSIVIIVHNILLLLCALCAVIFLYNSFSDIWPPEVRKTFEELKVLESQLCQDVTVDDESINPFSVRIDNNLASDLRMKLESELKRINNEGGSVDSKLKNLTKYWVKNYNWIGKREKLINKYPQFQTNIYGLDVHFQRIKPKIEILKLQQKQIRPLLLVHGRQSTFGEFQNIIPFLIDTENDSNITFELIIPTMPKFSYPKGNLGSAEIDMARIYMKLMNRIGHDKFYVHGAPGLGSTIASNIATLFPQNVVGVHLSSCQSRHPLAFVKDLAWNIIPAIVTMNIQEYYRLRHYYFQDHFSHSNEFLSSISPSSYSPTTLLAYFLQENSNSIESVHIDSFLDNIMMNWLAYYSNASILYNGRVVEKEQTALYNMERVPLFVPTSCAVTESQNFPPQSRYVIGDKFRQIIHFTNINKYKGRFPAMEIPGILAKDIISAFTLLEKKGFAFFEDHHRCQIQSYF